MTNEININDIYNIVRPHVNRFYRDFGWMIPNCVDKEDFMQQAAMIFIEKDGSQNAYHSCIDYLRTLMPKNGSEMTLYDHVCIDDPNISEQLKEKAIDPCDKILANQILSHLPKTIQKNEKYRYIIYRRFFKDDTFAEIGEDLGITKATVYEHFQNCMKLLKESIR